MLGIVAITVYKMCRKIPEEEVSRILYSHIYCSNLSPIKFPKDPESFYRTPNLGSQLEVHMWLNWLNLCWKILFSVAWLSQQISDTLTNQKDWYQTFNIILIFHWFKSWSRLQMKITVWQSATPCSATIGSLNFEQFCWSYISGHTFVTHYVSSANLTLQFCWSYIVGHTSKMS